MAPARLTLVAHTHWDREWYEPFEVFRAHLVETLDDALTQLERDPRLRFTLDGHVALVDDYLELRPEAEPRIRALVEAGRLFVGPFYTQADTLLADGESLIRNLAAGLRRGDALGGAMRVGYMPDQFGHAAQLPQILCLFGIHAAVLWRGVGPERPPHAFRWVAPDGSTVTTLWLQDGYGSGRRLPSDPQGFADAVERACARLEAWLGEVPLLVPVGDDHARLAAWLPDAAAALRSRWPSVEVQIGGYHDHFPALGEVSHEVHGELRSPVFAPVLAGVASARVREKQAAARAATLLLRYAEPLTAWARHAGADSKAAQDLIGRAWRQLFLNHAHDSAAGCGVDSAHEDVRARYRWAEQLGRAACERALSRLRVSMPSGASALAFHPGPSATTTVLEVQIPRSLEGPLVAIGGDGIARAAQPLDVIEQRALFEGELSPAELEQYLGGLDPTMPLFGRYLSGIVVHDEGGGVYRLDVGLGDAPARPGALADEQRRVAALLKDAVRIKVVLHATGPTRAALVEVGPAPQAGFVALTVRPGEAEVGEPRAQALSEGIGIAVDSVSVVAQPDGTVLISDSRLALGPVRANILIDDGDRGDLYHFESAGERAIPHRAEAAVTERGPVRATLRIVREMELPVALDEGRRGRAAPTHLTKVTTEISLCAGQRHVEFVTSFDNTVRDHRFRALFQAPFRAERADVEHGLAVVSRPIDVAASLGHGTERAAPTGQQHGFVDVADDTHGVALMSRGLPEYELLHVGDQTAVALTLLRSVGWLSRGDLTVSDIAAGPIVPTPDAQELGPHRFEYAILLHGGGWEAGGVLRESRRYQAPPMVVAARGEAEVPAQTPLVELTPRWVVLSAIHPSDKEGALVVRLLNASGRGTNATLRLGDGLRTAERIDPLEQALPPSELTVVDGTAQVSLRAWEIATIRVT